MSLTGPLWLQGVASSQPEEPAQWQTHRSKNLDECVPDTNPLSLKRGKSSRLLVVVITVGPVGSTERGVLAWSPGMVHVLGCLTHGSHGQLIQSPWSNLGEQEHSYGR